MRWMLVLCSVVVVVGTSTASDPQSASRARAALPMIIAKTPVEVVPNDNLPEVPAAQPMPTKRPFEALQHWAGWFVPQTPTRCATFTLLSPVLFPWRQWLPGRTPEVVVER